MGGALSRPVGEGVRPDQGAGSPVRDPARGEVEGVHPTPYAASSSGRHFPHVVAWNLTRRCNLTCAHCYIAAGAWHSDADELSTAECRRIIDQILAVNEAPMLILSGGEPLVRRDLEEIAEHAASSGATVVVGTNGTALTAERISSLKEAGVRGFAVSVDSLDPRYHDRFRHGEGALEETLAAVDRLREARLDVVVQTTLTRGNRVEIAELAAWAASVGAVSFNVYFVVRTGRGEGMRGLTPAENEAALVELLRLEREYRGQMLVRSKCQPQIMRHAHESDPESPLLDYATRCPCGVHYCRITPEGKVTPCPYMPAVAGDLRELPFERIWEESALFRLLRGGELGGKCGRCEYREVCGGCRARAYAQDGDFLDEDRSCAYEPPGDRAVVKPPRQVTYGSDPRQVGDARPDSEAEGSAGVRWTDEARERIGAIPSFVRPVVMGRVERFARRHGEPAVTLELLERIRAEMPIDFSKRAPFFLRDRR